MEAQKCELEHFYAMPPGLCASRSEGKSERWDFSYALDDENTKECVIVSWNRVNFGVALQRRNLSTSTCV